MGCFLCFLSFLWRARKVVLDIMHSKDVNMGIPLLARGRDRLETRRIDPEIEPVAFPLLARGRDRLETL